MEQAAINAVIRTLEQREHQASQGAAEAASVKGEFKKVTRRRYVCPGEEKCRNALCYHYNTVAVAGSGSAMVATNVPLKADVLTQLVMDKSEKDGFKVSIPYASYLLKMHDEKIVRALAAIKEDLTKREQRLKDQGRVSFDRESTLANNYADGGRARDQIILFFERDDQNLKELVQYGWSSSYGKMLQAYPEPQRTSWYNLYIEEGKFRDERQAYYKKMKAEYAAGTIAGGPGALDDIMKIFDRLSPHEAACTCRGCTLVKTSTSIEACQGARGKGELYTRAREAPYKKVKENRAKLRALSRAAQRAVGIEIDASADGEDAYEGMSLETAVAETGVLLKENYEIVRALKKHYKTARVVGGRDGSYVGKVDAPKLTDKQTQESPGSVAETGDVGTLREDLSQREWVEVEEYIERVQGIHDDISPSQLLFLADIARPVLDSARTTEAEVKGKGIEQGNAAEGTEEPTDLEAEKDRLYEKLRTLHHLIVGEHLEEAPFQQSDLDYVQKQCKIPEPFYVSTYLSLGGGSPLLAVAYQQAAHEEIDTFFYRLQKWDVDFSDFYIVVLEFFDDYILRRTAKQRRMMHPPYSMMCIE